MGKSAFSESSLTIFETVVTVGNKPGIAIADYVIEGFVRGGPGRHD
jgi:hypothetical protein